MGGVGVNSWGGKFFQEGGSPGGGGGVNMESPQRFCEQMGGGVLGSKPRAQNAVNVWRGGQEERVDSSFLRVTVSITVGTGRFKGKSLTSDSNRGKGRKSQREEKGNLRPQIRQLGDARI